MKKLFFTIAVGITLTPFALASNHNRGNNEKDTLAVKCKIFSANLYYGIELGEKPTPTMVDTLVGEISHYDTNIRLNLVVVTAKDLGFTNQTHILWNDILDSAQKKGYELCPAQAGPEVYVLSQNIPAQRRLLSQKVFCGKPIFIGMERIRHTLIKLKKGGFYPFRHKDFFDYVFCIKPNYQKHTYELGYCATNSTMEGKAYIWSYYDRFIFINNRSDGDRINKPNPGNNKDSYCKNK